MNATTFSLLAVPGFVILVLLEYYIGKRRGLRLFTLEDSVSNISIGIFERLCTVFSLPLSIWIFSWINKAFGIFTFSNKWYNWVLLFFLTDILWYLYHRLSHEINLFWSAHVVHHSSQEFNLTVAARITVFQTMVRTIFWTLLPIIGFNSTQIIVMLSVHAAYQLFLHTKLIGKLGWIEYIFVTPSHHRVHHGSNEKYLDKNYGGILIIWDRIFGTFVPETEEVKFGLKESLRSKSFLWSHFHFLVDILVSAFVFRGIRNKLKAIFGKPLYYIRNETAYRKVEDGFLGIQKISGKNLSQNLIIYVLTQLALVMGSLFYMQISGWDASMTDLLLLLVMVITLINCCALLDKKQWIIYLEYIRFMVICTLLIILFPNVTVVTVNIIIIVMAITLFEKAKELFFSTFYNQV